MWCSPVVPQGGAVVESEQVIDVRELLRIGRDLQCDRRNRWQTTRQDLQRPNPVVVTLVCSRCCDGTEPPVHLRAPSLQLDIRSKLKVVQLDGHPIAFDLELDKPEEVCPECPHTLTQQPRAVVKELEGLHVSGVTLP